MRAYGFRDTRTGGVTRCYGKEDALRVAANSITGRYVAVVCIDGEWRELVYGAPARPLRPAKLPRRTLGVKRASGGAFQRLWRKLRPERTEVVFVRHNGGRHV